MAKRKKQKVLRHELPEEFLARLSLIVGASRVADIRKTFVERPTTFRVNTIRSQKQQVDEYLRDHRVKVKPVSWNSDAFILLEPSKRVFTEYDLYTQGKVYIQSLASMVPPLVLDPQPGEKILDLTAAPGSKTSQIAALMEMKGELVANEVNKIRFFRLKHNMEGLGVVDDTRPDWKFSLRMEDGLALTKEYPEYFDKILLDAPCSGESRFIDGDPKTYGYWSEKKIKRLAFLQHSLLLACWSALRPGGVLVYSTCTLAPEENEVRISKLLERMNGAASVEKITLDGVRYLPPVTVWKDKQLHPDVQHTLRIFPTKEIEGFYIAKIRKNKEVTE